MLTPMDIHNKEFSRSFRGYDEDENDTLLDEVVNDFELLIKERNELRAQVDLLQEELDGLQNGVVKAAPAPEKEKAAEKPAEPEKPKAPEKPAEPEKVKETEPETPFVKTAKATGDETTLELVATNVALEAKVADYESQLAEYKKLDESLRSTLFLAQSHAKEITGKAEEEADKILSEAKTEADRLLGESRQEAEEQLTSARNEAITIISDAREEAKLQTEDALAEAEKAKAEAGETRRVTEAAAERILNTAKEEAEKIRTEAERDIAHYREDQENLVNSSREFLAKIRSLLAGQLAMLDEGSVEVLAGVSAAVAAAESEDSKAD